MRAGRPTGSGIRLRVYGVRLATVPAEEGFQLVTDDQGRLVPTGEKYRIPRAAAAQLPDAADCRISGCDCAEPDQGQNHASTNTAAADHR